MHILVGRKGTPSPISKKKYRELEDNVVKLQATIQELQITIDKIKEKLEKT